MMRLKMAIDTDLLKNVFEQNWLHAGHDEDERLWFSNIYDVIVAGVLAFMGGAEMSLEIYLPLILFLIMPTIIGIVVVIKLGLEFISTYPMLWRLLKPLALENIWGDL
jgi:hypothetical protein